MENQYPLSEKVRNEEIELDEAVDRIIAREADEHVGMYIISNPSLEAIKRAKLRHELREIHNQYCFERQNYNPRYEPGLSFEINERRYE